MANDAHIDLFASFRIDIQVNRAMNALGGDDNRDFPVYTSSECSPNLCVFRSIFSGVIDWEVAEACSVNDDGLNAALCYGFDLFCMQPRASSELSNPNAGLIRVRSFSDRSSRAVLNGFSIGGMKGMFDGSVFNMNHPEWLTVHSVECVSSRCMHFANTCSRQYGAHAIICIGVHDDNGGVAVRAQWFGPIRSPMNSAQQVLGSI